MATTQLQVVKLPTLADTAPEVVTEMDDLLTWAQKTTIRSAQSYLRCSEALSVIQRMRRAITSHYKSVKQPITTAHKEVLRLEKTDLARLVDGESRLQKLIITWEDEQAELSRQEAEVALSVAQDTGASIAPIASTVPTAVTHHRRSRRQVTITDLAALVAAVAAKTVPSEVLSANLPALNRMATEQGDLFEVPGVEVTVIDTVVNR